MYLKSSLTYAIVCKQKDKSAQMVTLQNPRELRTLWGFLSFTVDQAEAVFYSNSFNSLFTIPGSAFPFIAFIVCPTKNPMAFVFPD